MIAADLSPFTGTRFVSSPLAFSDINTLFWISIKAMTITLIQSGFTSSQFSFCQPYVLKLLVLFLITDVRYLVIKLEHWKFNH